MTMNRKFQMKETSSLHGSLNARNNVGSLHGSLNARNNFGSHEQGNAYSSRREEQAGRDWVSMCTASQRPRPKSKCGGVSTKDGTSLERGHGSPGQGGYQVNTAKLAEKRSSPETVVDFLGNALEELGFRIRNTLLDETTLSELELGVNFLTDSLRRCTEGKGKSTTAKTFDIITNDQMNNLYFELEAKTTEIERLETLLQTHSNANLELSRLQEESFSFQNECAVLELEKSNVAFLERENNYLRAKVNCLEHHEFIRQDLCLRIASIQATIADMRRRNDSMLARQQTFDSTIDNLWTVIEKLRDDEEFCNEVAETDNELGQKRSLCEANRTASFSFKSIICCKMIGCLK